MTGPDASELRDARDIRTAEGRTLAAILAPIATPDVFPYNPVESILAIEDEAIALAAARAAARADAEPGLVEMLEAATGGTLTHVNTGTGEALAMAWSEGHTAGFEEARADAEPALTVERLAQALHDSTVARFGGCPTLNRREHDTAHEVHAEAIIAALVTGAPTDSRSERCPSCPHRRHDGWCPDHFTGSGGCSCQMVSPLPAELAGAPTDEDGSRVTLDEAWAAVERVMPEGWWLHDLAAYSFDDMAYRAEACGAGSRDDLSKRDSDKRYGTVKYTTGPSVHAFGATPAAALLALAAALTPAPTPPPDAEVGP